MRKEHFEVWDSSTVLVIPIFTPALHWLVVSPIDESFIWKFQTETISVVDFWSSWNFQEASLAQLEGDHMLLIYSLFAFWLPLQWPAFTNPIADNL